MFRGIQFVAETTTMYAAKNRRYYDCVSFLLDRLYHLMRTQIDQNPPKFLLCSCVRVRFNSFAEVFTQRTTLAQQFAQ